MAILPYASDLLILFYFLAVIVVFGALGTALFGRDALPDQGLVAAWGLASLCLTIGGIAGSPRRPRAFSGEARPDLIGGGNRFAAEMRPSAEPRAPSPPLGERCGAVRDVPRQYAVVNRYG